MASGDHGARHIARAILMAAAMIVFVPIAWQVVQELRARREAEQLSAALKVSLDEAQRQAAIATYRSSNTMSAAYPARPARLRENEQCAGGFVVRRIEQPSPGYVQVLEGGRPARCSGRFRE